MDEVQRYRMTFKCNCGKVYKKLTTDINLEFAPCPSCKKKDKKTKLFKIGDGPVPSTETKADRDPTPRVYPNTVYKCCDCFVVMKVVEDIGETAHNECWACGSHNLQYRGKISKDISSDSTMRNKCVDKTADIVMTDYGMTDLKDNVRMGEAMAPKLPGGAQNMADQMMGAKSSDGMMSVYDANTRRIVKVSQRGKGATLAKKALSGSMRDKSYIDPVQTLHQAELRGRH